jgi:hypothetical protein
MINCNVCVYVYMGNAHLYLLLSFIVIIIIILHSSNRYKNIRMSHSAGHSYV